MGAKTRAIFAFMTRLPVSMQKDDFDSLSKSAPLFPLVGAVVGLGLYTVFELLQVSGIHHPMIQMISIVGIYYLICGGIHLDGVADVWDGMNCGGGRDKVFQAMSDSCVGTFGVIGLILAAGMAALGAYYATGIELFFAPIVGRSFALLFISLYPAAKKHGLGKPMIDACNGKTAVLAIVILLGITLVLPMAIFAYLAVMVLFFLKFRPFVQRLEGVTGDMIGFAIEMSQWLFLLILQGGHLL